MMRSYRDPLAGKDPGAPTNLPIKIGLGLAVVSLFLSLYGLVALAAVVCAFVGLVRTDGESRKALHTACAAFLVGGGSLLYSFVALL